MKKTAIMITIAILALITVLIVAVAASKRRAPAVDPSETIEEEVTESGAEEEPVEVVE